MSDERNPTEPNANPFQSPQSAESPGARHQRGPGAEQSRPKSPMVFGVISIVFAALGLLGAVVGLLAPADADSQEMLDAMGYTPAYMAVSQWLGPLFSVALLTIGILLIRYRDAGRKGFNAYACLVLIWSVVNAAYVIVNTTAYEGSSPIVTFVAMSTLIGAVIGSIFPILGLVFLNRPTVLRSLE